MKTFRKVISFLIVTVLFATLLPTAFLPVAAAADGDSVLTAIGHTDTTTYTFEGDERKIILLVPFSYSVSILNLTDGLDITYDTSIYEEVVASVDDTSQIGDDRFIDEDLDTAVNITVTFSRYDDEADAPRCETVYQVYVGRADVIHPTFSGTLLKDVKANGTLNFTAADFAQFYNKNDGKDLGFISIKGANEIGTMILNSSNYSYTSKIDISTIWQLSFSSNDISIADSVNYEVTAYADTVPPTPIDTIIMTITVYPEPKIDTPFSGTVNKGAVLTFTAADFASHCNLFGVPLLFVVITPINETYGTWYLGTEKITETKAVSADALGSLSFSGSAPGNATFSWNVTTMAGTSDAGTGVITVKSPVLTLIPQDSGGPVFKGGTWAVSVSDFRYTPSVPLTYIKITTLPAAADGTLVLTTALAKNDTYGYPGIAANANVPVNAVIPAAYIKYLRMTTKSTSTKSAVSFMWTATSDAKVTGATWGEPVGYTVNFMNAGPLSLTTDMNIPVGLSSTQLYNINRDIGTNFITTTGNALSYVTFILPDKNQGSLFLNYNPVTKAGTAVSASMKYYAAKSPNLSNITFVPGKDYTGTFSIMYTGYLEDGRFCAGSIAVTVANSAGGTVSYITDKNSALQLDAKDFQSAFLSATGKSLSHVSFSLPSTNQGKLVYNYTLSGDYDQDVASSGLYYVYGSPYLSLVTFIPYSNFTGSVTIYFTGTIENSTQSYAGKLVIFVVDSPAGIVKYPVRENGIATLSGADFSSELIGVTGSVLSYVTFTPPVAANGSLYYQYDADTQAGTKVTNATKYYDGKSTDISDISFIPPKDFTGTIVVAYKAFTVNGVSYDGKLKFTVFEGTDVIAYNAEPGKPLLMNSNDFFNAFYMNSIGKSLSYITFETPSSTYGRFYYNYTAPSKFDSVVSNDKKYYVSASPYISNVAFVPQENYSGTFNVTYTGYTSSGTSFTGKIKITVRGVNSGSVAYETSSSTPVTFKASDFITAFAGKSSYPLSSVKLTLPYESYGSLYYNYSSASSLTSVSPAQNYYVNTYSTPSLSSVTFVPNRDFSGVLAINYTAYDSSNNTFTGTILITVKSSDIGTITYGTNLNKPVLFNSDDFNAAFMTKSGSLLDRVTFTLPSPSAGTLYLGYNSPTSFTSKVSAATNYYRSYSPQLSSISFVPSTGYTGPVTILYTAYALNGSAYYGKIIINVGTAVPFTDMGNHEWAKEAVSYLYRSGVISDDGSGQYYPGVNMTRADFVVMIVNAFNITGGDSDNFPDVPVGSDYYDAVSAAKSLGIVRGSNDGTFNPQSGLTRQDAMVIIVRALEAVGYPMTGTADDLSGFSDVSTVSDYAVESVAALVRTGLVQGTGTSLNPKSMISRAETAVMLYRIMTM